MARMPDVENLSTGEEALLHYAAGVLLGMHERYGDYDVTVYHGSIRIRVERMGSREMVEGDL